MWLNIGIFAVAGFAAAFSSVRNFPPDARPSEEISRQVAGEFNVPKSSVDGYGNERRIGCAGIGDDGKGTSYNPRQDWMSHAGRILGGWLTPASSGATGATLLRVWRALD